MDDNEFKDFMREAASYFGAKAEDADIAVLGQARIESKVFKKDEAARAAEDEVNEFLGVDR